MLANYIELLTKNSSENKSAETPYEVLGVYVSGPIWTQAQTLMLDHLVSQKTIGLARVFARDQVKALRKNPALIKDAGALRERLEMTAGLVVHGNSDPRPRTLFHSSGASATGTRKELTALTGLHYERVRDLLTGRRRFALGWSRSAEEAKKGPATAGRPKAPPKPATKAPEPEFFQAGAADFF